MPTIDYTIAQSFKPVQIESPINQMANLYQLQGAQQANQLRGMQMDAATRALAQENALAAAYKKYTTPEGGVNFEGVQRELALGGQGALIPGLVKTQREAQKVESEAAMARDKLINERLQLSRSALDQIDPAAPDAAQQYLAWHKSNHADPVLGPYLKSQGSDEAQATARVMDAISAGKLPQLIEMSRDGVAKVQAAREPKPHAIDLGGKQVVVDFNPRSPTYKQVITETEKTALPAAPTSLAKLQQERAAVAQANPNDPRLKQYDDAIKKETQWRPQQIQITAPGAAPSDDALELAAQMYVQTGAMPPLGQGRSGTELRAKILNRAAAIVKEQTGGDAAAGAGSIAANKVDLASRAKATKDFATGMQGRQVTSFNTAIDHLATMDKLSDALQNNDTRAINYLGNIVAKQTGSSAPTDFNAARQIVTAEVIKAIVATGGGVTERQEAEANFANASSPEQLKGLIRTYKALLGGQLKSLGQQYEQTTGKKDFDKRLTSDARAEVAKLRGAEAQPNAAPKAMSAEDKQALEWANANPNDPRAAKIKQRLGR